MIDVKDHKGNVVLHLLNEEDANMTILDSVIAVPLNNGSVYHCELMASDYIKLVFSLPEAISLRKGCYIQDVNIGAVTLNNHLGWFILNKDAKPQYNAKTGGYDYELEMVAWYYAWNRYILKLNPEFGAQEASFALTTTMLDPSTGGHLGIIKKNIEHYFKGTLDQYDGLDVRFEVMYKTDGVNNLGLVENVAKAISYDNVRITDALSLIAQTYEYEWWVEGNVIFFGRCDKSLRNEPRTELNMGEQMASLSRANSSGEYATRIYAFGSTRNVSARYRKSLILDVKETGNVKRNYPDDGTDEWHDRTYIIDTLRKIQPIWYDPACRVKASKSTLATLPGLLDISVESNRKRIETSSTESVCTISKGSVNFKPIVNVMAEKCNSVSVELVLNIYDTDNKNSGNLIQQVNMGPVVGVNEVRLDGEYAVTVSDTCYVFSTMYITVEGAADGCKVSCATPMMTILEDNYYISTNLNVLDTDNNIVRTIPVIANPFFDLDYSDEAARLYLPYGESLAIGTRFTLDNVIKGKVPVECFTDDLKRDTTIIDLEKRLMLPLDKCPGNYVDSPEIIEDGKVVESEIVESVVVFEDVYPKKEVIVTDVSVDTQKVPNETDENPDGKRDKYLYRLLIDKDEFYYDSKYDLSGGRLSIAFQSGKLAGMEFEVKFEGLVTGTNNNSFLIFNNDNYGVELPNAGLFPSADDKVVFFNYDVSLISDDNNSLVSSAEKELYDKTVEYLKKSIIEGSTYTAVLMSDYAYGLNEVVQDKTYAKIFSLGDAVHLGHEGYFGAEGYDSRIIGIEIKIDIPYDSPSYTIGESSAYSRFSELEGKISQVKSSGITISGTGNGGGSGVDIITSKSATKPTDNNVYSALASDRKFLNKLNDDVAKGQITFEKGIEIGEGGYGGSISQDGKAELDSIGAREQLTVGKFVTGAEGQGAKFDKKGNGELQNLRVWNALSVSELRFDRASVLLGTNIQTYCGGVIGKVTKESDTAGYIDLEVEDDEVIGAIQNGALCKGYVNNPATNDTEDSDDWHGDIRYAGTTVAQFAIDWGEGDEPNATNTKHIRYELRPGTTQHPVVGMTFKGVGNMKDASLGFFTIATPKYTAEYAYVQSWVIDNAACCVHVSGADISGFASLIGEQTLNPAHGTICTNMYVRGTYRQLSNDRRFMYVAQDSNGILQDDETETITIKIRDGYLAERTSEFSLTFDGKAIAYDAGKEAFVCTVSFDEIEGEIETFVIKATDGKHELEESIRVRRLRANYNLNVLKSAVNTNAKYDEELTFNDGAPIQYNDSTTITNAVVGDTIMAVRRNGDAVCEVGDLCIRIDNNQEYVIANYEEVRIYGSVKSVVFTWYADSSHSEDRIYARQEIPVISTLNSYVIYHDGTDEPALPPVGMAISDYGWHEGQTSSSRWMSAKTSVDMLSGAWGQPVKIVGEDGRSVGIKGHVANASALALLTGVKDGDGYITDDDGHLHVYYSGTDSWTDVGRVQGEAGKNAYIHIKYSHDGGNSFSENNGETPAEWMAVYADFNPTDSSNLSDYYGKWKKLTGESSFVSMVFRRSSASSLAAPTGGSFAKPLPDGTEWSDGIPDGSLPIWVSRRIFWSDNRATDNWTTPKRMADTADFDVCYHGGEERPSSLPSAHHQSNQGNGWFDNPADCEGGFAVWMATDQLVNGIWQGWKVSRIKGEKGADGKDGKDGASYVGSSNYYLATPTKDAPETKPTSSELNGWTLGTIPSDYGKNKPYLWNVESIKVVRKGETAESVTFGDIHLLTYYGSDGSDGKGITSITEYFLATANRETPTVDTGYSTTPADYSAQKPYLWNKEVILFTDGTTKVQDWHIVAYWGQDGKDADSFELRVASAAANISRGYEDELCFNSGDSLEYNNGTALKTIEAGDRISACRYFNMAVTEVGRLFYQVDDNARTEVANNEEQTVPTDAAHVSFHWIDDNGEEISRKVIPVISNGVTRFVSFAFKRQNEMPDTPTSGMFHHPVPDAEGWSDDIPEGTAKVWMTRRDFYSDDRETSWSTPSPMTDTSDFDVEFSTNDNYVAIPEDIHGTEVDKSAWGWKNEGNKDSVWMATSTCKNGVWSQWSYSRIKGEDGRSYVGATELYYASDSDDAAKLPNHTISSHADWRSRIGDLAKPYSKERPYLWNFEIVEMIEAGGKSVLRATDPELISYWSKDGKGVESVDERYIATATDDKPTVDPTTCKTNSTEAGFSASKPYLWNNQRTKYSDGSYGEWTGWQQISYWGKDAELYEIRPYSTSANASTGVEEGITFNDGSDIQFNDGVICSTIEKGGTIYACRYYNGKVSTLGKLYVSVNGGSESLTSNNTGLTIGETDRYVTYIWRKDDNSEIVRTNIPVVSDGVTMFKSFVFKRSQNQPATPTTGSYVEPVPYAEGWSDGIPEGEYRVWMSSRVFSSDDRLSSWSTPSPMTDTETDDYAYSSSETKPSAPTTHGKQSDSVWHNEPSERDFWMAHDRKVNGVWQGWQIMRIKGEKGDKGDEGKKGLSAYEQWLAAGNKGSETDFLESLNGRAVSEVVEWYGVSNSSNTRPTTWHKGSIPSGEHSESNRYLWNYEQTKDQKGNIIVETTPVIIAIWTKDGRGVKSVTEYYALSTSSTSVTGSWSTTVPTMTSTNKYLWNYERITYTDEAYEDTKAVVIGVYGDKGDEGNPGPQGVQGCIIRTGEWTSGAEYLNETGIAGGYVDVVLIKNDSSATGWDAYRCKKNQKNGVVKYPPSYPDYWEPMYNIGALFTSLIIAKNAKLTFAQANQLLLQDDSGMVTGGMSGGNGLQIWAGSEGVNEDNLPVNPKFGVYSDGKSFSEGSMTTYGKNIIVDGKNYRLKVSEYNGNDDGQMAYYYPIVKMLVCAYIKYPTSGSVPELKDDDIKNVTVASPLPKTSPGGQTWTDEPVETNGYYWAGYKYTIYSDTSIEKSAVSPINGIQLSPNHTRTEITQVKMREEAFVYDENGNVKGLQTKYYDKAGNLSWTLDETGGFNASLDHYWSPNNRRYYFADGSSDGIANALSYLNSNAKDPAKFAFPDDKAGVFSIFCSANSTDSSKKQYDGFCVLGSTVSDVPEGMTGFSGVFTSGSIPKQRPTQLPIKDGFLIQDIGQYFFDFKIYKNGYQQGFVTFTWDGSRWVSDRLIR